MLRLFFCIGAAAFLAGCTLSAAVKGAQKRAMKHAPYDVVIVPGYPYVTDKYPYSSERYRILLNARLYWAKTLYDRGITKNIIFSGAAVHTPFVEGKIMSIMADSLGIPPEHLFIEDKAQHSTQNAVYGKRMAKELGFKKIALATDPYQFTYLRLLRSLLVPGTRILTFPPEEMVDFIKPVPHIDSSAAFVPDFISIDKQ